LTQIFHPLFCFIISPPIGERFHWLLAPIEFRSSFLFFPNPVSFLVSETRFRSHSPSQEKPFSAFSQPKVFCSFFEERDPAPRLPKTVNLVVERCLFPPPPCFFPGGVACSKIRPASPRPASTPPLFSCRNVLPPLLFFPPPECNSAFFLREEPPFFFPPAVRPTKWSTSTSFPLAVEETGDSRPFFTFIVQVNKSASCSPPPKQFLDFFLSPLFA